MEENKKTLLTKIQNLYNELGEILNIAPVEDECTKEENEMYADMQNLMESIIVADHYDAGDKLELKMKEEEYMNYIDEHRTYVKMACMSYGNMLCKLLDIPSFMLFNNIENHDKSKYLKEEEFDGYRQWFYPCSYETKNKELFDEAWKHHYEHNRHHPEFWNGEDMPPIAIAEMLLDWEAMSIKFNGNTYEYYKKERDNKGLSENTKKIIDDIIHIFK